MQKIIERSTLLNQQDQDYLLRYFARLPLERKLDVLNRHRKILFMRKQQEADEEIPINVVSYIALVLANKSHLADEKKLSAKRFEDMELNEVRELSIINLDKLKDKKKNSKTKREKVLGLWAVVRTLRQKKVSFRDISRYLKKHHRLEVGHSLIHSMWLELENRISEDQNVV